MILLFRYFGHIFSHWRARGNELSRAEQGALKATSGTWLLFNQHHWLQFACVTNCTKVEGSAPPPTFKFGGLEPPLPPPVPLPMVDNSPNKGNDQSLYCAYYAVVNKSVVHLKLACMFGKTLSPITYNFIFIYLYLYIFNNIVLLG